jgi:hypothetical protein
MYVCCMNIYFTNQASFDTVQGLMKRKSLAKVPASHLLLLGSLFEVSDKVGMSNAFYKEEVSDRMLYS